MKSDNKKRKILAIDDNPVNLQLLQAVIKRAQDIEVIVESDERKTVARAIEERPDIILLDVMMPQIDGFEVCHLLKHNEYTANIPVIFLTANSQTTAQISGYASGAIDYITKPFEPEILMSKIRVILNMIIHLENLLEEANTDKLTGLYNRRYLQEVLSPSVRDANLHDCDLSLIIIDIDYFKNIN
ncbi:MAG: response regulator, partial [Sedimentisphaerales bacterium]|nr:response regulator [Sedimentisphaerales bacterium]